MSNQFILSCQILEILKQVCQTLKAIIDIKDIQYWQNLLNLLKCQSLNR